MLPNWYATPGNVDRNPGGEISDNIIGMTPHALTKPKCQNRSIARDEFAWFTLEHRIVGRRRQQKAC